MLYDVSHPDHTLRSASQEIVKELYLTDLDEQVQSKLLTAYGNPSSVLSADTRGFIPENWP